MKFDPKQTGGLGRWRVLESLRDHRRALKVLGAVAEVYEPWGGREAWRGRVRRARARSFWRGPCWSVLVRGGGWP